MERKKYTGFMWSLKKNKKYQINSNKQYSGFKLQ